MISTNCNATLPAMTNVELSGMWTSRIQLLARPKHQIAGEHAGDNEAPTSGSPVSPRDCPHRQCQPRRRRGRRRGSRHGHRRPRHCRRTPTGTACCSGDAACCVDEHIGHERSCSGIRSRPAGSAAGDRAPPE